MKKHQVAGLALLLAVASASVRTAAAQPMMITSTPISSSDGVYVVQSTSGIFTMNNLLLVRPDSVVLVDTLPPNPGLYQLFVNEIHYRTQDQPVSTLINTSWHFDHVGLNADFRMVEGTDTITAHWRAGDYMTRPNCVEDIGLCMPALPDEAQPTQGVHGLVTLMPENERITLKTVENAHSGADLVVYLKQANVVYTGDVYFGGMYPIIDRTGGGTVNGTLHALNQILARINEDTVVVPSHGVLGNRESVIEFRKMLKTSRERIRKLIAEGLTEEQVMFHPSFATLDQQWGTSFVPGWMFRLIVYRDLAP